MRIKAPKNWRTIRDGFLERDIIDTDKEVPIVDNKLACPVCGSFAVRDVYCLIQYGVDVDMIRNACGCNECQAVFRWADLGSH